MKIFEFKYEDISDFVFANDLEEAKEYYLNHTNCGSLSGYTVEELPIEKWKDYYILDVNELEPDADEEDYNEENYCCGFLIVSTFYEYARSASPPDLFCSTSHF